jgi:hypothetical protein
MTEYPYYVRTLTNKINVPLLNFLYSKPSVSVTIDTNSYNIFMQMKTLEDYNHVLEEVKKYYTEYSVHIPPEPVFPEFVSAEVPTTTTPSEPPTTTTETTSTPTEPPTTTTETTSTPTEPPTTTTETS